jgi:hypothetical protein
MTFILLAAAIVQPIVLVPERPGWVATLLASKEAKAAMSAKLPKIVRSIGHPGANRSGVVVLGNPPRAVTESYPASPAWLEAMKTSEDAIHSMYRLIEANRFTDAFNGMAALRKARPELRDLTAEESIEGELVAGRYRDALDESARFINGSGQSYEELSLQYVRLSLASAAQGKIYDGQASYCEAKLKEYFEEEHPGATFCPAVYAPFKAKQVTLLSDLALGMQNGVASQAYFQNALRIDPTNLMAADEAIRRYQFQNRFSDVIRTADTIAAHLPAGELRRQYEEISRQAHGKLDIAPTS